MPDTSNDETRDSPYGENFAKDQTIMAVVRLNYDLNLNYPELYKNIFGLTYLL